jgi:hypothetical protein
MQKREELRQKRYWYYYIGAEKQRLVTGGKISFSERGGE